MGRAIKSMERDVQFARRSRWLVRVVIPCVALVLLVPPTVAHAPGFQDAGHSAETARVLDDPTKSRVFYDRLEAGHQHWFKMDLEADTRMYLSIVLPPAEVARPTLWLLGPGLPPGDVSEGAPPDVGGLRVTAVDKLSLEPFSPLAMRTVAEWDDRVRASGTYYVVVETDQDVDYSVAIGTRESFTPMEWMRIPLDRIEIQAWGGVPRGLAILGEVLAVAFVAVAYRGVVVREPRQFVGRLGAAAVAGSALTVLILTGIAMARAGWSGAVLVPIIYAVAAAAIGYAAWRAVIRAAPRWTGILWAVAAVVAWAGLLLGPLLLLIWTLWPPQDAPSPPTPATPAGGV